MARAEQDNAMRAPAAPDSAKAAAVTESAQTVAAPEGAQAVDRAMALLGMVGRGGPEGTGLMELAHALTLSKPTARRLLIALIRAGLIDQDAQTRRYHLGQQSYALGVMAARRHGIGEQAGDAVARLARDSGDTAFISTRSGDWAICLRRQEGVFPVRSHVLQAGDSHPLGVGAGSLAMLAAMADRKAVIARLAPFYALYPGYSAEHLLAACEQADAVGYAVNPGLVLSSSWGIGVAVLLPDGQVAGALSIATPDSRMRPDRQAELGALLHREAKIVADRLAALFRARSG